MNRPTRRPSRPKAALFGLGLGLGLAATLLWHGLRARRLLEHTRQIAAQSAGFPRDYYLGSGPPLTYLAMGDSTAAGWGAGELASTYPHQVAQALANRGLRVHVVNVAVGGATLATVLSGQSEALSRVRPDLVTLSVGANDATHRTSDADFRRELQQLWVDFAASQARVVLVANVPDMDLTPALPLPIARYCGSRARALNAIFGAIPKNPKVHFIDWFGRGKLDYERDPGLFAADLFHPSARGYAIWAALFVEGRGAALDLDAPKEPARVQARSD